eukprot:2537540-Alexandrium_andersonii.AAC.1
MAGLGGSRQGDAIDEIKQRAWCLTTTRIDVSTADRATYQSLMAAIPQPTSLRPAIALALTNAPLGTT